MAKVHINGEIFDFDREKRPMAEMIALEKELGELVGLIPFREDDQIDAIGSWPVGHNRRADGLRAAVKSRGQANEAGRDHAQRAAGTVATKFRYGAVVRIPSPPSCPP